MRKQADKWFVVLLFLIVAHSTYLAHRERRENKERIDRLWERVLHVERVCTKVDLETIGYGEYMRITRDE